MVENTSAASVAAESERYSGPSHCNSIKGVSAIEEV